jgi:hypothetical protein
MCPHLRQYLLVSFQLLLAILDLLASVTHFFRVSGNLGAQASLSLVGQMTMILNLHQTLQAQSDEQTEGDDKEMHKDFLDAVQLFVGYVNVNHNILQINYWTSL